MSDSNPVQIYMNKVRVRVSGILIENDKILLVNHSGLTPNSIFWSPPGGGIEFGENSKDALKREFMEETGLEVKVGDFLFINEVKTNNLHAIELFFEVKKLSGNIVIGKDPEHELNQLIINVEFLSLDQLHKLPKSSFHYSLQNLRKICDIFDSAGYSLFSST